MSTPETIWTLLLSGLVWFMRTFALPLFGDATSEAAAINFGKEIWINTAVMLSLIYDTVGSVVNLNLFAILMGTTVALFFIKTPLAIYQTLKRLNPFGG